MGKEEVAVTDVVEAVSSSALMRLDRSVQTRLCALRKECDATYRGRHIISPKDQSKWVCGSIAVYKSSKHC